MNAVVPHPFLFRYAIPVRKVPRLPRRSKTLLGLSADCRLPNLREIEGAHPFADVRAAWNEKGIGVSVEVRGRTCPLACDPRDPAGSDGLQVWIDTRNTQNIHRAGRFCHHFCYLPAQTTGDAGNPMAVQLPIGRSRDEVEMADSSDLPVRVTSFKNGYRLEAWLSAAVLTGFDAEANPRLGFYYCVQDSELGRQLLTVEKEFPFSHDPSVWSTLELTE